LTFTETQEEAILDIGGEPLLALAHHQVYLLQQAPPFQFPSKEKMEKQRARLRRALGSASRELRILISALHGINARQYGYGGELPEGFDVIAYLEALLAVPYDKARGDQVRQTIITETRAAFVSLEIDLDDSRSGDLVAYLKILNSALGTSYDEQQLARDIVAR
jgi:hypothetical protein